MRHFLRATLLVVLAVLAGSPARAQLIAPDTALRYGLVRPWFAQVGAGRATGALEHVNYDEGLLLVQSHAGVLTALDAETGRTHWTTQVGARDRATSEPAANDKYVVMLNGSTLFVINRATGEILWQKPVSNAPGAGPGVSRTHAFVPLISGMIEGYDLAKTDKQTPWNYKSAGRVVTPPMTTESTLSWTTDRGYLYVADPAAGGIRYRLETRDEIASRPASWSPRLFAGSTDGYVYAIEENKGRILWKFPVGEAIYDQLAAIEGQVFAVTEFGGLYCLNANDGRPQWHISGIKQFVAKSPSRVYALNSQGNLAILDSTTGARLGVFPLSGSPRVLVNTKSDRIFVVDKLCVIQCLHEAALASPVLHIPPKPVVEEAKPKATLRKPAKPTAEEAPAEPAEEPAKPEEPSDDPFGADKPAEPKEAEPANEAENPFDTKP